MGSANKPSPAAGLGMLGAGAVACAVCCAGPILGFLAATGIASVLGAVVFGSAGLVVVLAVTAVLWRRRRRRRRTQPCEPAGESGPTQVPTPRLRSHL